MPTILKFHTVEKISFSGDLMILDVDARRVKFDLHQVSPLLAAASPVQRMRYEVSPSGYGVRSDVFSAVGKSAGTFCVTLPVAAHSVPRWSVTTNPVQAIAA